MCDRKLRLFNWPREHRAPGENEACGSFFGIEAIPENGLPQSKLGRGGGRRQPNVAAQTVKLTPRLRIPAATYRIQFNRDFPLRKGHEIVAYLHDLGISDIYASPLFQAGPDSTHGYDVCAFDRLNANVSGEKDFYEFADRLHETGMGLLLDIVPNHMRTDCVNRLFAVLLARGPRSRYGS